MLKGSSSGKVFSKRVPSQVTFLNELLYVKWSRATGSSLEKTTTGEERDNRKHLRRRSKFEDREKISVIIS